MKTVFLIVLTLYGFSTINATLYQTINDGQFFDSAVWDRNEVPKFLNGDSIIIKNHIIAYDQSKIFGNNNNIKVWMEITNTGILCLEKEYRVVNLNLYIKGNLYTKKVYFEYDIVEVTGNHFSSDAIIVQNSGRYSVIITGHTEIDTTARCPEIPVDTETYINKCPKLSFAYRNNIINDTTSKITFWNSQEAVMKVKIKDSIYTVLHGNYIYFKHLLEEEIPIKILAIDNCDRAKEFNFKLSYAKTSSSSIHSGVMENMDFIVKKTSQYSWVFESKNSSNHNYHIYDINGRSIQKGQFLNSVEINLKDLSSGLYFIEINNTQRQNKYFSKLVLED